MIATTLSKGLSKERWLGMFLATLLLFPLLPLLLAYFSSQHLSFALYGMSKYFCLLYLLEFVYNFAPPQSWKPYYIGLPIGYTIAIFSLLAGFSAYGLFLGLSSLIFLCQRYRLNPTNSLQQKPSSLHPILTRILILALILLPILNIELVETFRQTSVFLVDRLLDLTGVRFERIGITYFLQTIDVVVEEKCSGSSSTRAFLIIIAAFFLRRKAYLQFWTMALPLAVLCGLATNTTRIYLHILYTLQNGKAPAPWFHEALGVFCFALCLLPILHYEFKKMHAVIKVQTQENNPQTNSSSVINRSAFISLVAIVILTSGTSMYLHQRYTVAKVLTHQSYEGPNIETTSWIRSYRFTEKRGGGGWILLEHPIEYCMILAGWNVDGERIYTNQAGKTLQLTTTFQIGERQFSSRTMALLVKWFDVRTWGQDLKAEVRIQESIAIPHLTNLLGN